MPILNMYTSSIPYVEPFKSSAKSIYAEIKLFDELVLDTNKSIHLGYLRIVETDVSEQLKLTNLAKDTFL